jgi:SAM-dependent methyltransferase
MGIYTEHTTTWLDRRYSRVGQDGVYQAHMPIYGLDHPASEAGHAVRYAISFRILSVLNELEFDSVLAVGGGEGFLPHLVRASFGSHVAVADLSVEAGLRAADFFDLDAVAADATRLPFADDAFDVVVCSEVVEHLEFPLEALLELRRVARRAVIVTTLEFETDPRVVARHRFQRCRFPHFEQNLYLPEDFVTILGPQVRLATQFPMDVPEDGAGRAALEAWLRATRGIDGIVEGGAGVLLTDELMPSGRAERLTLDELLEVLFERSSVPATPLERRMREGVSPWLLERLVCPRTHAPLVLDGARLHTADTAQHYEVREGVPVLYDLATPDPTADDLRQRCAGRPAQELERLLVLRADLVGTPEDEAHGTRRLVWDLTREDDRRGWMLNPSLDEVAGAGLSVVASDNDPWFVAPAVFLPTAAVAGVRVRMRVHAPGAPVESGVGQVFWALDGDDVFTEARSVTFVVANAPDVREYTIDLRAALADVQDRTLLMFRLDPADGACGIDVFEFEVLSAPIAS